MFMILLKYFNLVDTCLVEEKGDALQRVIMLPIYMSQEGQAVF